MSDFPYHVASRYWAYSGGSPSNRISFSMPTEKVKNDIAIVLLLQTAGTTISTPTGYTSIAFWSYGSFDMRVVWKRLVGTESSSYADSNAGTAWRASICSIFRGCVQTGTPYDTWVAQNDAFAATVNIPAITTSGVDRLCANLNLKYVAVGASANDNATDYSEDADLTIVVHGGLGTVYTKEVASAGAQAADSFTTVGSGSGMGMCLPLISDGLYYPYYAGIATLLNSARYTTTLSVTIPGGDVADDIVFCPIMTNNTSQTCSTPTGWTLASGPDDAGTFRSWLFWRRFTGTEGGNVSFTITSSSAYTFGGMCIYRDCIDSGTPWDGTIQKTLETPANTTMNIPALTTLGASRLCTSICTVNDNNIPNDNATDYVREGYIGNFYNASLDVYSQGVLTASSVSADSYTLPASELAVVYAIPLIPLNLPKYEHKVTGVVPASIGKVTPVATASIAKVTGV